MLRRRLCLLFALSGLTAFAQEKPGRLTFEVQTVKPTKPDQRGGGIKALPGGQEYVADGAPVKLMIALMYKIPMRQITGGPEWMDTDRWDVRAKAERPSNLDDLHVMFQNLITDEFGMKFHKEVKEGPVYALTVDKSGLKMKVNEKPQDFQVPVQGGFAGVTIGKRVPMEYLTWYLGQQLQRDNRPVVDYTGLKGNYDWTLDFAPELPPNFPRENLPAGFLDRPSIFDAVKQQLGLKLEPQKGPVEYYVIDHIEKPQN